MSPTCLVERASEVIQCPPKNPEAVPPPGQVAQVDVVGTSAGQTGTPRTVEHRQASVGRTETAVERTEEAVGRIGAGIEEIDTTEVGRVERRRDGEVAFGEESAAVLAQVEPHG